MTKLIIFCLLGMLASTTAQRITTIHLDGVQYFISRMNPYSPELNYFLAYQYCRSLGLQLASFETKEKAESMTTYLKNAGYGNYDFWTSGNRLGTGMFLWMSTGLPFNATFDFFENSADAIQAGLLDPVDHNSNTSPQRTARDSSSGAEKGCVVLKQPTLKWMPEDCSAVKDFICEQTRCYYYNYGSIPVSSAQGRPIRATTPHPVAAAMNLHPSTTPLPIIMSTYATFAKRAQQEAAESQQPSLVSLKLDHERALDSVEVALESDLVDDEIEHRDEDDNADADADDAHESNAVSEEHARELNDVKEHVLSLLSVNEHDDQEQAAAASSTTNSEEQTQVDDAQDDIKNRHSDSGENKDDLTKNHDSAAPATEEMPTTSPTVPFERVTAAPVEVRLKQISQEVEQMASGNGGSKEKNQYAHNSIAAAISHDNDDIGRQSFLSLTDLIRTLRPNDKQIIPQIDSDYSNAMRVLGETSAVVNNNSN